MDQRIPDVVSLAEVQEVFAIVSEATTTKRPRLPETPMERHLAQLSELVMTHAMLGFVTMLVIAALAYYSHSYPLLNTTAAVGFLSILCVFVFFILTILAAIPLVVKVRKAPYSPILGLVKLAIDFDLQYARRLAICDKIAVQYVLMQYKYERNGLEKRGGVLSGSLEKIGLFPALGAVALLSVGLSNIGFGNGWIQMLAPLILAFHFLNLATFGMLQKMDKVIALLEFSLASRP